jgi:hypothetical protein
MSATTLAAIAAGLRELAAAIDVADTGLPVHAYLSVTPAYTADGTESVARVDEVAALFGLNAAPTKRGCVWYHEAHDDRPGVELRVHTIIAAPAQRCACGAVCAHGEG